MSYKTFMKRMCHTGANLREEYVNNVRAMMAEGYVDDVAYIEAGVTFWGTEDRIYPRVFEQKDRTTGTPQIQMQTLYDENFEVGDIFTFPNGENWLCTYKPMRYGLYNQGTIDFCNYLLKFKSLISGEVVSYPVSMINATQYNSGGKFKNQVSIGTSQHMIFIPCNEETILLDHDYRLMIDRNSSSPTIYKISQTDPTSYYKGGKGVLRYTVVEDRYNPDTDDKDLLVASYTDIPLKNRSEGASNWEVWWSEA